VNVRINRSLINKIELTGDSESEIKDLLQEFSDELDNRIDRHLTKDLSAQQLYDLDAFFSKDTSAAIIWLKHYLPNYKSDPCYKYLRRALGGMAESEAKILSEYARMNWLNINYPKYHKIVQVELSKLCEEEKGTYGEETF
jgi:hypothetical protein